MEQTRRESESIIADLKRMKKEQQNPDAQVNAIRRRIENNVDNLSEGLLQKVDTGLPPKEVRKGDTVEILTIGSQGTVLAPANAKGAAGKSVSDSHERRDLGRQDHCGHPEAEGEHQPASSGEAAGQAEAPADERTPENRRDGTHGADGMRRARHGAR